MSKQNGSTNGHGSDEPLIPTHDLQVANGRAHVDDRVTVNERPGRIESFPWTPNRVGGISGYTVLVRFDDDQEPKTKGYQPDVVFVVAAGERETPPEDDVYPVPSDMSFGAEPIKDAGDLEQIAHDFIQGTGDFEKLRGMKIAYRWLRQGGSSNGQPNYAWTRKPGKYERPATKAVIMIVLAADTVRLARLNKQQVEALVHERLCAIGTDKKSKVFIKGADFRGYSRNVERFGAILPTVRQAVAVLRESKDERADSMFSAEDLGVGAK